MKLTYPVCCGVDVHKTFLVATIITSEYVMPHYHQKRFSTLKKKASDVVEAVSGFNMTPEQKERVRIVQGHFADIDHRITQLDEIIGNLVAEYEGQISLLCTIPGIQRRTAITILSEIGTDMSQFGSSKRLCNWAGLAPASNQSAGKKKSVRISRAGVYLKPALVEAAHAAVKSTEKQPYYRRMVSSYPHRNWNWEFYFQTTADNSGSFRRQLSMPAYLFLLKNGRIRRFSH